VIADPRFEKGLNNKGLPDMETERPHTFRQLAYFSSLGMSLVLAIVIGLVMGLFLDAKLDTHPVLTLVCLAVGIAAGYRNIGHAIRKSRTL
jgi:ATP synthase protein I